MVSIRTCATATYYQEEHLQKSPILYTEDEYDIVEIRGRGVTDAYIQAEVQRLMASQRTKGTSGKDDDVIVCHLPHPGKQQFLSSIRTGDTATMERLLDAGVSVNACRPAFHGIAETALIDACRCCQAGVVELLVERGADVHRIDAEKRTALHHASYGGDPRLVLSLIEGGANVNAECTTEFGGNTPLWYACKENDTRSARILFESGAKTDAVVTVFSSFERKLRNEYPEMTQKLIGEVAARREALLEIGFPEIVVDNWILPSLLHKNCFEAAALEEKSGEVSDTHGAVEKESAAGAVEQNPSRAKGRRRPRPISKRRRAPRRPNGRVRLSRRRWGVRERTEPTTKL